MLNYTGNTRPKGKVPLFAETEALRTREILNLITVSSKMIMLTLGSDLERFSQGQRLKTAFCNFKVVIDITMCR